MSNEEAKQEAIKKAYGSHYSICKPDLSGWGEAINIDTDKYDVRGDYGLRPKSLNGIEDNNGWIRIEPDGSNLPTDNALFKSYNENQDKISPNILDRDTIVSRFKLKTCTHYKPITPELKPIY